MTRPVVTVSRDRSKLLPDVPTVFQAAKLDTEQQWWMDFRANLNDLAAKLAAIRAEGEAMASAGRAVSGEELEASMARVRTASAAFRAALETAEAGAR